MEVGWNFIVPYFESRIRESGLFYKILEAFSFNFISGNICNACSHYGRYAHSL